MYFKELNGLYIINNPVDIFILCEIKNIKMAEVNYIASITTC